MWSQKMLWVMWVQAHSTKDLIIQNKVDQPLSRAIPNGSKLNIWGLNEAVWGNKSRRQKLSFWQFLTFDTKGGFLYRWKGRVCLCFYGWRLCSATKAYLRASCYLRLKNVETYRQTPSRLANCPSRSLYLSLTLSVSVSNVYFQDKENGSSWID